MLFRPLISFAVFAISCCIITMSLSEIFGTMTEGDKLDGPNYALWSFMLRNILVGKGLRDIVSGDETRLVAASASTSSFTTTGALHLLLLLLQLFWRSIRNLIGGMPKPCL